MDWVYLLFIIVFILWIIWYFYPSIKKCLKIKEKKELLKQETVYETARTFSSKLDFRV